MATVGIDLANNFLSVHGVGIDGKVILKRNVGRADRQINAIEKTELRNERQMKTPG